MAANPPHCCTFRDTVGEIEVQTLVQALVTQPLVTCVMRQGLSPGSPPGLAWHRGRLATVRPTAHGI